MPLDYTEAFLQQLECSISTKRHYVEKAFQLSCGHYICKKCRPKDKNCNLMCLKCNQTNSADMSKCKGISIAEIIRNTIREQIKKKFKGK
jgi:hypothetical protein